MRQPGTILHSAADAAVGCGVIVSLAAALLATTPANAQDCPGNPDAIGTSRVLTLAPNEFARVGRMQYPETLPLADHEIVLTFDDGPLPPYSNQVLDILAAQCVKATYFIIGKMALDFPAVVRRIHAAGHTIGTHSEHHPVGFGKLPLERMRSEIDNGIADVGAALGDPSELAPFFRIPGLARSDTLESELAARSLVVFSADVVADDWHRRIKPDQIIARALSRLEARGRGILLLHDIHPATVAALPGLFKELKAQNFHIVQLVPAAPAAPGETENLAAAAAGTVTWDAAEQEMLDDSSGVIIWPPAVAGSIAGLVMLPAPDANAFDVDGLTAPASPATVEAGQHVADAGGALTPSAAPPWPSRPLSALPVSLPSSTAQLPSPSIEDIGLRLQAAPAGAETGASDAIATASDSHARAMHSPGLSEHKPRRHERFRTHRHARIPAGGQHAGLTAALRRAVASLGDAQSPRASRSF
jgi:peptidoglycan/xylan/chitin deacetylase (PgdA/CDA1 family)